jgi:hypothetical protein
MTALIILRDVVGTEEMSLFASWSLLCGVAERFGFSRALPRSIVLSFTLRQNFRVILRHFHPPTPLSPPAHNASILQATMHNIAARLSFPNYSIPLWVYLRSTRLHEFFSGPAWSNSGRLILPLTRPIRN